MSIEQEFATEVQKHFAALTPLLDAEITDVAKANYPDDVKFFLVEYDSPEFSEKFSVSLWPMDRRGEAVAEGHWFLIDTAVVVPSEIYDAERFDSINPWQTASGLFEQWFIERWQQCALGCLPAFIGHHDSYFKRNLQTGEQFNWDQIVSKA